MFFVSTWHSVLLSKYPRVKSVGPAVGFPGGASGKEPTCQCKRPKRHRFHPWVRKIPWSRKWQPIPVSLPGESHGHRNLVGHRPWGYKELDVTEQLSTAQSVTKGFPAGTELAPSFLHGIRHRLRAVPFLLEPVPGEVRVYPEPRISSTLSSQINPLFLL